MGRVITLKIGQSAGKEPKYRYDKIQGSPSTTLKVIFKNFGYKKMGMNTKALK
jgi:hypothetical protein